MNRSTQKVLRAVASAKSFRNPFVGKRGRWYEIDAATMREIRKLARGAR